MPMTATNCRNKLPDDADMRYDFADIEEVGKQLKIDYRFTDSDASQIFLHQLDRQAVPSTNYASAEHTRYYTLWQLRRALQLGRALLLLASTVWATAIVWQSGGNATEAESLEYPGTTPAEGSAADHAELPQSPTHLPPT